MHRDPGEQQLALECLKLAAGDIAHAEQLLAFVTGDAAAVKLAAVRAAISQ